MFAGRLGRQPSRAGEVQRQWTPQSVLCNTTAPGLATAAQPQLRFATRCCSNTYDILNWRLDFTFAGGNFTWGPSDGDVTWQGMAVSGRSLASRTGSCMAGWDGAVESDYAENIRARHHRRLSPAPPMAHCACLFADPAGPAGPEAVVPGNQGGGHQGDPLWWQRAAAHQPAGRVGTHGRQPCVCLGGLGCMGGSCGSAWARGASAAAPSRHKPMQSLLTLLQFLPCRSLFKSCRC